MGIEDILGSVGGDQMQRVLQIVRQVDDNWDGLMQAVDFIAEHGEDLIDLLGRLPDILERAGVALGTAAEAAVEASSFLTAGDGLDADDIAGSAGRAMAVCQEHLSSVAGLLDRVGDELAGIKVPTLDIERNEIMGLSVVSGVDVGSQQVAAGAARDVQASASQLKDVADALATAGDGLGRLQVNLSAAGDRINSLAGDVEASGSALAELSGSKGRGGRSAKKRPATRKAAAKKKPTTRKATSRKATTRKAAGKKKPAARKAAVRKAASKKKPATRKATARKAAAKKKPATRKAATRKAAAKKKPAARKAATRKATTRKATSRKAAAKKKPTTRKAAPKKRSATRREPSAKLGQGVLKPRS